MNRELQKKRFNAARRPSDFVVVLILSLLIGKISNAQEKIDKSLVPHKWEMNLNVGGYLLPEENKTWSFLYLMKRHNQDGGAWRFMVLPYLINLTDYPQPGSSVSSKTDNYYWVLNALVGYQWQKQKGKFAYLYGIDAAFRYKNQTGNNEDFRWQSPNGLRVGFNKVIDETPSFWVSPFVGVQYFISHRFSLSIESHLNFVQSSTTNRTYFEGERVKYEKTVDRQIQFAGLQSFAFNYHF